MLIHVLNKCFSNYYWLYVIASFIVFIYDKDFNSILAGLTIVYGTLSLFRTKNDFRLVDGIVCIFILYSLVSYVFSSYNFELYYYGIRYQIIFILFYFIGRCRNKFLDGFYENFRKPLLFVFICGLILYFWAPSWYMDPKMAEISQWSTDHQIQEATRLSSFWPHSYFCGYSSLFFLMYLMIKKVINGKKERYFSVKIFIAGLVLFFSQQRVSIAFFVLFLLFLIVFSKKYNLPGFAYLIKILAAFIVFGLVVFFVVISKMDASFLEYVLERTYIYSDSAGGNFIIKRIHMFDSFLPYVSVFGNGVGRFGHHALTLRLPCISDNEYMRGLCELGFVGMGILFTIIGILLTKAFSNMKNLFFEFMVVLFFVIAMVGATPLEMATQQNFLLWFCLGRIRRFNYLDKRGGE